MKPKFILVYIVSFCAYLFFSTASATDIRVTADRTQIQLNETFTLTFEASDNVDDDPDFSPLADDFEIISKSSSSNISINNGKYKKTSRWLVALLPMKVGTITIPSIDFGSDQSPPYQITIKPAQQSSNRKGVAFISELEISTETAYIQSQIVVIQRMLSARNINGYEFAPLETSGVEVASEVLGDIKQYQIKIGTTPYLVLEKIHVLYPQTSGILQIKPSLASARVTLNKRSSYDPFRSNSKTVRRSSDKKSINIKTIPGSFKGRHWLPAHEVQLVEEFPENTRFKAGEPITRTISLLVDGQSASQLPEIHMPETNGLKQYPDKPVLNDNKRDDGITGVQQIKFALIPSTGGSYTLPAISVPWWNTKTDKMQMAKIPARTFKVDAAMGSSNASSPKPAVSSPEKVANSAGNKQLPVMPGTASGAASAAATEQADSSLLWKITTLLLVCAWAATLAILWKEKRRNKPEDATKPETKHSLKQAYRQLKSACEKKDAQACKNALLVWGSALFDERAIHSLGSLAQYVDKPLADKINQLNAHLYKQDTKDWACSNLADLCMIFEKNFTHTRANKSSQQLESLYR